MEEQDAPATKRDLGELETRLKGDMQAMEDRLKGDMRAMEDRLLEATRDAQTEILRAFYPFQEAISSQFRVQNVTLRSYDERIQILERRLWEIEKRLLMHPPAA